MLHVHIMTKQTAPPLHLFDFFSPREIRNLWKPNLPPLVTDGRCVDLSLQSSSKLTLSTLWKNKKIEDKSSS